jgi:hypothetical protein
VGNTCLDEEGSGQRNREANSIEMCHVRIQGYTPSSSTTKH